MASIDLGTKGALETHIFSFTATTTTETVQLSPGTRVYGAFAVITSATPRVVGGFTYDATTGVLTVGVVANTDTGFIVVIHE